MPPSIALVPGSVRKVQQLTGQYDRELRHDTPSQTESRFHLFGTDGGFSFEHDGALWFLFGDTWPSPGDAPTDAKDSIAWTIAGAPEFGVALQFLNDDGFYRPPSLVDTDGAPLSVAGFEVPVAGFSLTLENRPQMYVFYTTDHFQEVGTAGGLDAVWVAPGGAVAANWANPTIDGGRWTPPAPLPAPNASGPAGRLAAVSRFGVGIDVFWIGPDGAIATSWANQGLKDAGWRPPFPITPPGAARGDSRVAAITRFDGALDVFWIGPDGAIATGWANPQRDNGIWHPAFPITPPGAAGVNSPLAAITRFAGALDAFWVGPDGAIATTWANPQVSDGAWHAAFPITPPRSAGTSTAMAAITRFNGAIDLFWTAPGGTIMTAWTNPEINNGAWRAPFAIAGQGAARADSPIAAVTRFDGALDVFWIGPDGAIATNWANPGVADGAWHSAFPITPPGAAGEDGGLAAVTRLEGALDVFWVGPDGAAATAGAIPGVNGGAWGGAFPITAPGQVGPGGQIAAVTRTNGGTLDLMGRTVLARAVDNDPTNLRAIYTTAWLSEGGKFIGVCCRVALGGLIGLPFDGDALLVWGTGRYRGSDVYFACVPLPFVTDPDAWWYFTGKANWSWSQAQADAVPLFDQPQIGELSVSWIEPLGLWLMLYNAPQPRGINGRVSATPWGPWSDIVTIFDPGWPGLGYGHFMHLAGESDCLSDPGREDESGGEYAPYIIDRYTEASGPGAARVYFTLSTWNPYNVMLMTAAIQLA